MQAISRTWVLSRCSAIVHSTVGNQWRLRGVERVCGHQFFLLAVPLYSTGTVIVIRLSIRATLLVCAEEGWPKAKRPAPGIKAGFNEGIQAVQSTHLAQVFVQYVLVIIEHKDWKAERIVRARGRTVQLSGTPAGHTGKMWSPRRRPSSCFVNAPALVTTGTYVAMLCCAKVHETLLRAIVASCTRAPLDCAFSHRCHTSIKCVLQFEPVVTSDCQIFLHMDGNFVRLHVVIWCEPSGDVGLKELPADRQPNIRGWR